MHKKNSFVTLTYAPEKYNGNTLVPEHIQNWLKRLRSRIEPERIRYYGVGEYGGETQRPHYHVALFGLGLFDGKLIEDTWSYGFVHIGELTFASAQYVAKYVTKADTNKNDPRVAAWLNGRHPEYPFMSRHPGIGATAISTIASTVTSTFGAEKLAEDGDVPTHLRHGSRLLPLGRYLRKKLREKIGMDEKAPKEKVEEFNQKMRDLFDEAYANYPYNPELVSEKKIIQHFNQQKIANLESKFKIFNNKGVL